MPRRTQTKKTSRKRTKIISTGSRFQRKDMRFNVSLVILMGMLIFSVLLLFVSLYRSAKVGAGAKARIARIIPNNTGPKKSGNQIVDDSSLDFKITVPNELGKWFYKTGEVKSLTSKSLSDQYLQIYVPLPDAKSNDFNQENKDILTIRKFNADEWDAISKACKKGDASICDPAGELIIKGPDSNGDDWAYAYTKPVDCPKSIEAKCALADKIVESFQLK